MREILSPKALPPTPMRYSPCIRTGPFYHFAGMIGLDPSTLKVVDGGVYEETKQILLNLQNTLTELEMTLQNLVTTTIYTTQFDQFPQINQAWEETFTVNQPPPARTSIGVTALPLNATVEMEFRLYNSSKAAPGQPKIL